MAESRALLDVGTIISPGCLRVRAGGLDRAWLPVRTFGKCPSSVALGPLGHTLGCVCVGRQDGLEEAQRWRVRELAMTTATGVGFVEMRIAKVVGVGGAEDEVVCCVVVLDEVAGDRQLPILIGQAEAFSLAARLGGIEWRRPMTYQFVAALVQALGGRVRQVRIDRVVEGAYAATVAVEGPLSMASVDARPS